MRRLLCVALVLLCFAHGGNAAAKKPLPEKEDELGVTYVPYVNNSGGLEEEWKPVRIAVNMATARDALAGCEYFKGKGTMRNIEGYYANFDKSICEKIGGLAPGHLLRFFREVVPKAVKLHADRLLVKPVEGDLKVPGQDIKFPRRACRGVKIGGYDEKIGIPNADVVLYVGLTTSSEPVTDVCKTDAKGRPLAASIRLRPNDFYGRDNEHIRLFAHHIAHGIGFDEVLNNASVISSPEAGREGIVPYEYSDENMLEKIQKIFGCKETISAIKMDGAMDGAPRLHFRDGVVKGELMSPLDASRGSNEMVYSALSLAVFESTGHFKADFGGAEQPEGWKEKQKELCKAREL